MALYMIGLGLWDEKDISLKGLETVRRCSHVFLESYTSRLSCPIETLEKLYKKKIIIADRDMVESRADEILDKAKDRDVAFLVIGDVFGATTHTDLRLRAREKNIPVSIIHNASIMSAIGTVGLELYKFGKTTSIPFYNQNVRSPVEVFEKNLEAGLHTLFLLDLDPGQDRYMSVAEAASYLIRIGLDPETQAIGCAGIGSDHPQIRPMALGQLEKAHLDLLPQCLIIPGSLHFIEQEAIDSWR